MPNKNSLMNAHSSASTMLKWANTAHGVCNTLDSVKKMIGGSVEVTCCMDSNHNDTFQGIGLDKHEALASALSTRFPA